MLCASLLEGSCTLLRPHWRAREVMPHCDWLRKAKTLSVNSLGDSSIGINQSIYLVAVNSHSIRRTRKFRERDQHVWGEDIDNVIGRQMIVDLMNGRAYCRSQ